MAEQTCPCGAAAEILTPVDDRAVPMCEPCAFAAVGIEAAPVVLYAAPAEAVTAEADPVN